jgi:hypothetical protein
MAYSVFVSHSTHDQGLVMALANTLSKYGVGVRVAEWYIAGGHTLSDKVRAQIKEADSVIVFLTGNGTRSRWVQQEVGIALGANRLVIPLVEKGTPAEELAALQGKDYIEYDPARPQDALDRAAGYVGSLKAKKEEKERALLAIGGIIAFLLLLSGDSK